MRIHGTTQWGRGSRQGKWSRGIDHNKEVPKISWWCTRSAWERGLVSISAIMSLVNTWQTFTFPRLTHSRMRWYRASMYLFWSWCSGFLARASAPSFSTWRGTGRRGRMQSSDRTLPSHMPSLQESGNALYFDSIQERERQLVACAIPRIWSRNQHNKCMPN